MFSQTKIVADGIGCLATVAVSSAYTSATPNYSMMQKSSPLALIPIHSDAIDKDLWITISLDRVNVVLSLNIIY